MRTLCHLIVVGTALALSSVDYAVAQPESSLLYHQPQNLPVNSNSSNKRSTSTLKAPRTTISSPVNLSQRSPQNGLPSVDPAMPAPATTVPASEVTPSAPFPAPTPAPPSQAVPPPPASPPAPIAPPAPTSPLDNLNPNPSLLESPTDPSQVETRSTQPITLQQSLDLARRNNRPLQVGVLELERARRAVREARAELSPDLNTQVDLSRVLQPGGFNSQTNQSSDAPATILNGTLGLSYDIFTSGRRSATIRAAEEQVRFSELEVERLSEQLRLDVSNDYYSVQEADEQVRIARATIANSQASLRDAQALEGAGLGTRFEVLQQQVEVANDQQTLTEALAQQRIARRQLVQRLSLAQTVDVSAADPVELAARYERTLEESIILAFQNRAELAQQLAQRNISQAQRRIALAAIRPQISAFLNYDVRNFNIANDAQGFSGFQDGYSYGARFNLNIFDGGAARARADQEEANIRIAETNFADIRNQVRFQVEQAFFNLQSTFANTGTATTALGQARESLRLARLRFQAGVGTQTDVISAQSALTEAESNVVQAIIGYNRALSSLQREISGPSVAGTAR